jgi:hypothetical protein
MLRSKAFSQRAKAILAVVFLPLFVSAIVDSQKERTTTSDTRTTQNSRLPDPESPGTGKATVNLGAESVSFPAPASYRSALLPVSLEVSTEQNDGKLSVSGKTNLPEETRIAISISTQLFGETISAFEKVPVRNGAFRTNSPLSYKKAALPSATYKLSVSMPVFGQPTSVQEIIGKNGSNLTGDTVAETKARVKLARVENDIKIDGGVSDEANKRLSAEFKKQRDELLSLYRELESFKNSERFLRAGFAPAGHGDWLKRASLLRDSIGDAWGNYRSAAFALVSLGEELQRHKGKETDSAKTYREAFSTSLDDLE